MTTHHARREPRAPIELRVQYRRMNSFFAEYTKNISRGGTFIRTEKPLPPGTEFRFLLEVPARNEPFELIGRVAWVRERQPDSDPDVEPGMGIHFIPTDDSGAFEQEIESMMRASLGPEIYEKLVNERLLN